ncbi:MAG: hypothetical protein WC782_03860 [Methylococcaceae bacterium]|jgi:hypothetical protein
MKFTKTLVAAALLASAASANATLIGGPLNNDGSSELYLQLYNPNYVNANNTLGATYNYDTNVSFSQLETVARSGNFSSLNTLLTQSLSSDARFNTFIAQNNATGPGLGGVRYGLYVGNNLTQTDVGTFVTITAPATQLDPNDPTVFPEVAANNAQRRAAQISLGLGDNTSSIIANIPATPERGQAITSGLNFDSGFAGFAGEVSTVAFGQSIDFRYIFATARTFIDPLFGDEVTSLTYDATQDQILLGSFNLGAQGLSFTAAGGSVPSVPLPAAVWMFGAGLLGVLRLNRRKAA